MTLKEEIRKALEIAQCEGFVDEAIDQILSLLSQRIIKAIPKEEKEKSFDEMHCNLEDYSHYRTAVANRNNALSEVRAVLKELLNGTK